MSWISVILLFILSILLSTCSIAYILKDRWKKGVPQKEQFLAYTWVFLFFLYKHNNRQIEKTKDRENDLLITLTDPQQLTPLKAGRNSNGLLSLHPFTLTLLNCYYKRKHIRINLSSLEYFSSRAFLQQCCSFFSDSIQNKHKKFVFISSYTAWIIKAGSFLIFFDNTFTTKSVSYLSLTLDFKIMVHPIMTYLKLKFNIFFASLLVQFKIFYLFL